MNEILYDMLTTLEEGNPGQPSEEILMLYEDWCSEDNKAMEEIEEIREEIHNGNEANSSTRTKTASNGRNRSR